MKLSGQVDVDEINSLLNWSKDICHQLRFSKASNLLQLASPDNRTQIYRVTVTTTPGGAVFEGTVSYVSQDKKASVIGFISRLNKYEGQDFCMNKKDLKLYCFCKKT